MKNNLKEGEGVKALSAPEVYRKIRERALGEPFLDEHWEYWKKQYDYLLKDILAAMKFPDSDLVAVVSRCKECGSRIAEGNEYCGECLCEVDCE